MQHDRFKAYRITNRVNGKVYIGITGMTLSKRWSSHVSHARNGGRMPVLAAIRKYGAESFDMEHIASATCWANLCIAEKLLIEQYGSFGNGYNATRGGQGVSGIVWSEATKKLRAESRRRTLARQGGSILKGRPRGAAVSAHLSAVLKGRVFSAETKAKMSAAQKRRVFTDAERIRFKRDGDKRRAAGRVLTDEQVVAMRSQRTEGVQLRDLSVFYGLALSAVYSCVRGTTYKHVPMPTGCA